MQSFIRYSVNGLYILVIVFVVLSLSAYAFVGKEAKAEIDPSILVGKVIKEEQPQVATTQGFINTVNVKVGEPIKVDDEIALLSLAEDNETDSAIATDEAGQMVSNASGIVQKVLVKKGQQVEKDQLLANIITDENTQMTLDVNEDDYKKVRELKDIYFYSKRLDQTFAVEISLLNPSVLGGDNSSNSFQLNFTFKNLEESRSLLHNERLELMIPHEKEKHSLTDILLNFIH